MEAVDVAFPVDASHPAAKRFLERVALLADRPLVASAVFLAGKDSRVDKSFPADNPLSVGAETGTMIEIGIAVAVVSPSGSTARRRMAWTSAPTLTVRVITTCPTAAIRLASTIKRVIGMHILAVM